MTTQQAIDILTAAAAGSSRDIWAEVDAVKYLRQAAYTIDDIARSTGMSAGTVRNRLLLAQYSPQARHSIPSQIPFAAAYYAARHSMTDFALDRANMGLRTTVAILRERRDGFTTYTVPFAATEPTVASPSTMLAQVDTLIASATASTVAERAELLEVLNEVRDLIEISGAS